MSKDKSESILSRKIHPVKLGLISVFLMLAMMLILRIAGDQQLESNKLFYWEIALVFAVAYALFNCVFSLNVDDRLKYFISSLLVYAILVLVGVFMSSYFSGLAIEEAGSFKWLFKLFSFCYLILITVFNLMSTIMAIIRKQNEDIKRQQNKRTS